MPKAPRVSTSTRMPRRSSRLNKNYASPQPIHTPTVANVRKRKSIVKAHSSLCTKDETHSVAQRPLSPLESRRSHRMTSDLLKREKALATEELESKRRASELEERILSVTKREAEASRILAQVAEREAAASLAQLEEHFTCALCYEVLAHPYTLNPGNCGHTFCALCILKWFFSRLHFHCGSWHESVVCPVCRSPLIITPDRTPRPDTTFPFVPNRTVAGVCESLIEKLRCSPSRAMVVKREDSEGAWEAGWPNCTRKKEASKDIDEVGENADLAAWRESGFTRTEWLKKDRQADPLFPLDCQPLIPVPTHQRR